MDYNTELNEKIYGVAMKYANEDLRYEAVISDIREAGLENHDDDELMRVIRLAELSECAYTLYDYLYNSETDGCSINYNTIEELKELADKLYYQACVMRGCEEDIFENNKNTTKWKKELAEQIAYEQRGTV